MPDTGNAKDCHPQIFIFYLKKRDLTNFFDQFLSTVMFSISFCLYRACFTDLISLNLSCNLCLWYFDQLVHLNKEINANIYRHSLWEYSKRFHCSFEWHLTPFIYRNPGKIPLWALKKSPLLIQCVYCNLDSRNLQFPIFRDGQSNLKDL